MEENKLMRNRWISSVDIINKTGISRATLNNYIKMGLLPPPNVRKPAEATIRARMIGYFPDTVLDRLVQINTMKKNGLSMKIIIDEIEKIDTVRLSGEIIERDEAKPEATKSENTSPHIQNEARISPQDIRYPFSSRKSGIQDLLQKPVPTLISFCVLVADLLDSDRICAELPPEEYFELIGRIWTCVEDSFKKYGGGHGSYGRKAMHFYFLKEDDPRYTLNALRCALEIRENIKALNGAWQSRKGWQNDIYLNIGLHEGHEYVGAIQMVSGTELISLGDAVDIARRLSDFACRGAIWVTKNVMNGLTPEERTGIRYGIRQRDGDKKLLIEKSFGRLGELLNPGDPKKDGLMDLATLAVAEIL
jgi:class 3 adenylate cyclase